MKTTIKKRFDQLEPGDVLPGTDRSALVVYIVVDHGSGACRDVLCMVIGMRGTIRSLTQASADMVEVERAVELTPAQQHADELLDLVRRAVGIGTNDWDKRAFALLDKIDPPQPPTLAEALCLLRGVASHQAGAGLGSLHDAIESVVDRARRSGALK